MTSLGTLLRRQREAAGATVEQIAGRLCLTSTYLRALENDEVTALPGAFFYRSFAHQYGAMLGVEEDILRDGINTVCPVPPPMEVTPEARPERRGFFTSWHAPKAHAARSGSPESNVSTVGATSGA